MSREPPFLSPSANTGAHGSVPGEAAANDGAPPLRASARLYRQPVPLRRFSRAYVARNDRPADKAARYLEVEAEVLAVLDGEPNVTARMATVASMLADAFDHYFWTGFYVVAPDKPQELVVGPYQGTLGCLRIAFGRGVCGAAAATGRTQLVEDVHAFPGHIACDSRSASEIVVPVRDASGALIAVFDVDATTPAAFDTDDQEALERLMAKVFASA